MNFHDKWFWHIFLTADNSEITIGIAGPDIAEDGRPGRWINTVGYSSDGVCRTSHNDVANTHGAQYSTGISISVYFQKI